MKYVTAIAVLIVGIAGWMQYDNRRRVIDEGATESGVTWELGWLPDPNTDDGVCVDLRSTGDVGGVSVRYCGASDVPAATETFPPVLGHLLIGWAPESEVKSTVEGEMFVSPPVSAFADQRIFVQFVDSDEFPLEGVTVNGRPVVNS